MKPLAFAARSLRREFRHAELATLAAALVLAVAALAAVATLAGRVERALLASAAELVGGDLGLTSSKPLPAEFADEARRRGLAISRLADFPSVAFAGERSRLVDVRAADEAFPLRGESRVVGTDGIAHAAHAPPAGSVHAERAALSALAVDIGGRLQLGGRDLTVAGEIVQTPDGGNPFRLAPRVLMSLADAQASGMIGVGSRARHRLLVAGNAAAVDAFAAWAKPRLPDGAELTTVRDAQQNLRSAFERGESFLRLAALIAALLSGIAIALAAQHFARRKVAEVALLRCLGARRGEILAALLLQLALLAIPACLLGLALGLGLQEGVLRLAGGLLPGALPPWPWAPSLASLAVGAAVLFGFALPPLLRLREVAPMRVFRREDNASVRRFRALYLLPLAVGAVLLQFGAGNLRLAATLAAGFGAVALATFLLGLALLWLVRRAASRLRGALRFGLANLARRRALTLLQAGALSLGLTALATLAVIGPSLLAQWRANLPDDTPNWFVLNLQSEQLGDVEQQLRQLGASHLNALPLAVGKLVAINGRAPEPKDYADRRAAGWINGEARLSWSASLPEANHLLEGAWFAPDLATPQLSVDRMWVDMFRLKLGDTMTLRVGEQEVTATISSIRTVDWESFRANFFLLLDPASGAKLPHSHVASFHLDASAATSLGELARAHPNLSLIDLGAILDRVREVIDRVSGAATWVLGFSLVAGVLVLLAALAATADERRHEAALLRTLGAHKRQLDIAALAEFATLGLLAGVIAIAGAAGIGALLARQVFRLDGYLPPLPSLVAVVFGAAVLVALTGWAGTRGIARTSPMTVLRRA